MTCTEPIRLNSAAATEFEPLGVSDHPPANERSEAEGAAVSTAYQVNSSFYADCSGMGTGLTFSVVRYGFADSRFALGVLGVGSGSKRPKLLGVALLCRAAPLLEPSMRPTCGFATAYRDAFPAGTCLTLGRRCETFSLLLSQSTQTAAPRFSGRCSRTKPDSGAGGCCPPRPLPSECGLPEGRPLLRPV